MSYSFRIRAPAPPPYPGVLAAVGIEELACGEGDPGDGPWPDGTLHFYRPGVSCRAAEITFHLGEFEIRILACSAPEDYDVAFRFVEALGRVCAPTVTPEDGAEFPAGELRKRRDAKWIEDQIEGGLAVLRSLIREKGETVAFDGAVRPFHIGPRLLSELEGASFPNRLFEAIRAAQHVDTSRYFPASVLPVAADPAFTVTAWTEGVAYLFPPVDYLVLQTEKISDESVFLPHAALPDVAGDRFRWLDEKQALVEAFEGGDWSSLMKRARERRAYPLDPPRKLKKKWWRPWR